MKGEHYEEYELLAWLDGNSDVLELESASAHFLVCASCEAQLSDLRNFLVFLSDTSVHLHSKRTSRLPSRGDVRFAVAEIAREERDSVRAERTFADLMDRPLETWPEYLSGHQDERTEELVRRLIEEARRELDRRPEQALRILDVATDVADALTGVFQLAEQRGAIAKECGNALRMLGRYPEALQSLDSAELFLSQLPNPDYDLTFVQWARASVLFYMTRYADAAMVAENVIGTFERYGDTRFANQARSLLANTLCEQGRVTEARDMYLGLLGYFGNTGDEDLIARLNANLAECEVRLDRADAAKAYAAHAMRHYEALGKPVERIRVRWTLGYQLFRQGHHDLALDELRWAAAAFESLGMIAAAGSVGLDMTELHLARDEWDEAEQLARYLVKIFSAAEAALHLASAFAYLRDAVAGRQADAALIEYLRSYVEQNDERIPFSPPPKQA